MLAVTAHGLKDIRVEEVDRPTLQAPSDAILRVTTAALCGSDLHIYHDKIPGLAPGTVIGHEFCGVVEEVGDGVVDIQVGDRVVASMFPACGHCPACLASDHRNCPHFALFGFGAGFGGLAGGQSEFVRVPFADMTLRAIPAGLNDEATIFTGDILSTAYAALRGAGTKEGDTVAIVGAGPVGQLAAQCAHLFGAARTFVFDLVPERLAAVERYGVTAINVTEGDPVKAMRDRNDGAWADVVIEAVGSAAGLETAFRLVRVNGVLAMVGMLIDEPWPISAGQAWLRNIKIVPILGEPLLYRDELLRLIAAGRIDATDIISDRMPLASAAEAYAAFDNREVQKVIFEVGK